MPFWLSSLVLPEDVLEHLEKASGHIVPSDIEGLVSVLRNQKAITAAKHDLLKHDYESYLRFCTSLGLDPGGVQSSARKFEVLNPRALVGTMETNDPVDILKSIPVTFGEMDRLRDFEQTLKDLEGLIDLLSRIRERFSVVENNKEDMLRLFIVSSGKGVTFRLVYEPISSARMKHPREFSTKRSIRAQPSASSHLDMQRWIEYGQRALLENASKTSVTV